MSSLELRIPKHETKVTLWVHPEGRVVGCLFLGFQHESVEPEEPLEAINQSTPFIVVRRESPEEIRFYNKSSIIRVEYQETVDQKPVDVEPIHCQLHMMDGSAIDGAVCRLLPPDRSRFYDFLNLPEERFLKVYAGAQEVCLINKSYIVCATTSD